MAADESRRILLVDDNLDSARTLGRLLELWGHEVHVAHYGTQGFEEAAGRSARTCHLLDIGLPGIDGYEIVRRLRPYATPDVLAMIALTGYGQDDDRRASAAL